MPHNLLIEASGSSLFRVKYSAVCKGNVLNIRNVLVIIMYTYVCVYLERERQTETKRKEGVDFLYGHSQVNPVCTVSVRILVETLTHSDQSALFIVPLAYKY